MAAARQVAAVVDSIYNNVSAVAKIIVAGDFNDYSNSESIQLLCSKRMTEVRKEPRDAMVPRELIAIKACGVVLTTYL